MTRKLVLLATILGFGSSFAAAEGGPPPTAPEGGGGIPGGSLLPRGAEQALNLTGDQRKQLTALETEVRTKLGTILTAEQMEKIRALQPAPPGGQANRGSGGTAVAVNNSANSGAPTIAAVVPVVPATPLPAGITRRPVVFSGGHDTVPVDHGRPVVLIAAALGVPDEVFREAFSHVHPAGPGSGGPTDAEARTNKAALMNALGKLGVTDDRLNTVSGFYRYPPGSRSLWRNKPATANALVKNGAIVGYEITDGGYGYTTPPTVSVPGMEAATAHVAISYGKDFETNGAVAAITISTPK